MERSTMQVEMKLSAVMAKIREKSKATSSKQIAERDYFNTMILEVIGDKEVSAITAQDCEALLKQLCSSATHATAKQIFTDFKHILRYGGVTKNPCDAIDTPFNKVGSLSHSMSQSLENANPYSSDELQGIIDRLVVPEVSNDKPVWEQPANFWIPLIGMFSGLRKTEITQLHTSNVIIKDGISCFLVDDAIKGQSLKSALRRRVVPIHPKLIELGMLEYAKGCSHYLFPELRIKHGVHDWTWFNRTVRKAISTDTEKSFSSLRNGVSSQLIRAGLDNRDYHYLIGIVDETGQDVEQQQPTVATLKAAIDNLEYPGVNFDRLKL